MTARPVRTGRAFVRGGSTMLALLSLAFGAPIGMARARQAAASDPAQTETVAVLEPTIVARYPHDRAAFTEGLLWADGALYESVGMPGESEVRRVALIDGRILTHARIPVTEFGEGLAFCDGALISLTWHDGIAHRWSLPALRPRGLRRYAGEGWGLTCRAGVLVRSDGTATLTLHDPATLAVRGKIAVTLRGKPVDQLNELEAVDGALLANVWRTPYIVRIDPATGRVTAIVDLSSIVAEVAGRIGTGDTDAVANGIAWDAAKKRLFITGKRWPTVFEVTLAAR